MLAVVSRTPVAWECRPRSARNALTKQARLGLADELPGTLDQLSPHPRVSSFARECAEIYSTGHEHEGNRPTKAVIDGGSVQMSTRGLSKPKPTRHV